MRRYSLLVVIALLVGVFLAGCGGINENLRMRAEGLPDRIKAAEKKVSTLEKEYAKATSSPSFAFFKPYAEREKWTISFENARGQIADAKTYSEQAKKILDKNDSNEEGLLLEQLSLASSAIKNASTLARKPKDRMIFLDNVKKKAPKLALKAEAELKQERNLFLALQRTVSNVESTYPNKKDDLVKRFAVFEKCDRSSCTACNIMKQELGSKTADFAKLGDNCVLITDQLNWLKENDKKLRQKISELGRSYSKTLIDMKLIEKPWKEVARYEWDTWSDWDNTSETSRDKIYVDKAEYSRLEADLNANPDGVCLDGGGDFDGYGVYLEDADIEEHYYHKYKVMENGITTTTDWVEVDPAFFESNEDNLNMDIIVKPYGFYEEDVIKTATPPGMAYVGNTKYGHWQGSGPGSFWVWYGQYKFLETMLGGNRYTYGEWNDWNRGYRGRRPYYGYDKKKDEDRYGTGSGYVRTRYAGSHWGKSGGFRTEDSSVRGAGASMRGGGPGGGGK